jgi:hypothetical protein
MLDAVEFGDRIAFQHEHALFAIVRMQRDRSARTEFGDAIEHAGRSYAARHQRSGAGAAATLMGLDVARSQNAAFGFRHRLFPNNSRVSSLAVQPTCAIKSSSSLAKLRC